MPYQQRKTRAVPLFWFLCLPYGYKMFAVCNYSYYEHLGFNARNLFIVHCSLDSWTYGSFKKRALYFFCRSFCKYLSMCRFYRTLSTMIMLFCVTFFHHTLVTLFHTSLYVLNNCRAALFFFSAVVESKTERPEDVLSGSLGARGRWELKWVWELKIITWTPSHIWTGSVTNC